MRELVLDGVFSLHHLLAGAGLFHHIGQPVIGLGTDDEIDNGRPAQYLLALSLCDAAGNADQRLAALSLALGLDAADAAKLGIDLLGRLFANMAGVEKNEIGVLHRLGSDITLGGQRIGHALAVIDVHLAAIGLDEDLPGRTRFSDNFVHWPLTRPSVRRTTVVFTPLG